ncbi:ABC transporter permease [Motilimonas cestriensis]|uniref:Histidine/lysine/arginine/ornithine transport system permease protein HisM n=1 Tax=Motilimonas cestriensis TaxID=2742685 RepID=A0ABS8W8K4_9GAMM|nr:ABC transporter permease [Motilimonas cestriensis]MCE2595334.1 ABC transporter permease [Motilimonas cestriensis]
MSLEAFFLWFSQFEYVQLLINEWPLYLSGLWTTLWLVALSLFLGLFIAVPAGIMNNSNNWAIKFPAWAFIYFFRGTPLLIQLFLIYYGAGQFLANNEHPIALAIWPWFQEAWFCALLAFTLNTGAYTAEIVRGSINTMPSGEIEAAKAYGLSRFKIMSRIVLPSSFRRALPAYSNEVIFMLHGSALAGVVTIVDLTGAARIVNSRYYAPFEAFITAGMLYMMTTFVIVFLFKKWEARWHKHLKPLKV